MHKRTSLFELLDQFVDAQQLDIKGYSSGHLNESKSFHPPNHAPHYLWSVTTSYQCLCQKHMLNHRTR